MTFDLETLDLLQERLAEYPGTVLLVSHDRDFLDRVVTSVIVAEGNGRWIEYAGGYTDMLAQRAASGSRASPSAAAKKPARPAPSTPRPAVPRSRRMSFKDRHALEGGMLAGADRGVTGENRRAECFARRPRILYARS